MRKGRACVFAKYNLGTRALRQLTMTADEIGVQVRFDYVLNLQPLCLRFIDVLIDIALRIYYCSFPVRTNQVRRLSQATEIELLEIHKYLLTTGFRSNSAVDPRVKQEATRYLPLEGRVERRRRRCGFGPRRIQTKRCRATLATALQIMTLPPRAICAINELTD